MVCTDLSDCLIVCARTLLVFCDVAGSTLSMKEEEDDLSTPRRPATYSFIAVSKTPGLPWELEEGRWIQRGVEPKEELIRVRRLPAGVGPARQVPPTFPCFVSSQPPGVAEGDHQVFANPHRQQIHLTTLQGQRASRAVAFVAAEQQRRASCSATCRAQPTGYIAHHDPTTVTELRQFWEQVPTGLDGNPAKRHPGERTRQEKSRSAAASVGRERRRRYTCGDTPRSSVSVRTAV